VANHLITGFPGFIGRRLVAKLLARDEGERVVAVVEERMVAAARDAAGEIDAERIEVIAGDIGERRLGLDEEDYGRLAAETEYVHHLAAIYDLAVPLEIAQRVNVDGTGNVIDFCRACERLRRHNYVSTAYVAGDRIGIVYEHELVVGQGFKNHYESTKFQAEVWVRQLLAEVPTTIFRPGIVVGDSRTGETQKFDGPYYVLSFAAAMKRRGLAVPNIGRGETPFNVVPIDFVVDALAELGFAEEAVGETLHLCDPDPVTANEMCTLLTEQLIGERPRYRVPAGPVAFALRFEPIREFFGGSPSEAIRYLNHPVRYDTRRAGELLAASGLRCPRFPEYVEAMVRFYRENADRPEMFPGKLN
jgi:thioester reductase-like protein